VSLELTLQNALSGLQTSQIALQTISNNIANANTEGYSRQIVQQNARVIDGRGFGVELGQINRNVDEGILRLLRTETGTTQKLTLQENFLSQINQFFGRPEDNSSITHLMAELGSQFDALAVTPETEATHFMAVSAGKDILRELKQMSDEIQRLRSNANTKISSAITEFNTAVDTVFKANTQVVEFTISNLPTAESEDQRDRALNTMSEIMDIGYFESSSGALTVFGGGGQNIVSGSKTQKLTFTSPSTMTGSIEYTPPSASNYIAPGTTGHPVGGIPGIFAGEESSSTDITPNILNGRLKGLIDMRDSELPALQAQLDELAEKLKDQINTVHNKGAGFPPAFALTGDRYVESGSKFNATGQIRVGIVNDSGALQEDKVFDLSLPEGFATYESSLFSSATSDAITSAGTLTFKGDVGASFTTTVAYTASDTLTTLGAKISTALNGSQGITGTIITEGSNRRLKISDAGGQTFNITETASGSFLTDITPKVRSVGDLVTGLSAMTNLTAAIDSTDRLALTASNGHRVAINELTSSVSGAGDLNKGISDFFGLNRFIDSNENFSTYRSDSYTSSTVDVVTTAGTLHFSGNDGSAWSTTVAYTAADTLTTLAAKINADSTLSTETIAASVVTDGALFRLELVDDNGDEFAISETGSGTVLSDTNLRVDARGLSGKMEIRTDIRENTSLISRGTLQSNTFESKSLNSNTTAFSGTTPTAAAGTLTFTLDASTTVAIAYTTSSTLDTVVAAINSNSTLQAAKISAEVLIDGSSFKLKIVDANSDDFMVVDSGGLTVDVSQGVNSGDSSVAEDLAASFNTAISFNEVPARGSVGGLGAATTTLTDYSARILSVSSARGLTIVNSLEFQDNLRSELATRNAAVSGVNMDEEMANMIIFEQAYLAAARLISMAQELYRTLTEIV